ncbi:hypothetical protein KY290_037935 [Solanum tuberosum]|uniref:Uncharacterized protein n=1 Tax=Solanum tuberosum TaxID=4113 RepID=A0ABQ7TXL1_SOLTU|nr:hypothetical protein KY284_037303 [Solanum tuberosum]KAH0637587.1 hypothetical protein KY289_037502 [Solanum tuberosum]KAH0640700.1 hypothetical protein KY285_037286 [Solanum tuberosum]KAH0739230.1 hypothetical protein KY290_037935 [Solanum tuberosum]
MGLKCSAYDLQGCAPSVCRSIFGMMRKRIVSNKLQAIGVVVGHQPSSKSLNIDWESHWLLLRW